MKILRDTIIAGNWKMNKSPIETKQYFEEFNDLVKDTKFKVILCVPFVDIPTAIEYGCKIIYFIIDENNSLKDELEGQESDSSDIIEFKYIYSLNEII